VKLHEAINMGGKSIDTILHDCESLVHFFAGIANIKLKEPQPSIYQSKPFVDLLESSIDFIESFVDLLESSIDFIESFVDLPESSIDFDEPFVDLLESSIYLPQPRIRPAESGPDQSLQ